MKKIYNLLAVIAILFSTSVFTACSDDETLRPLDKANVLLDNSAYNTLTFSWNKVPQAVQYSYSLADPDGNMVTTGVTNTTSVTITDLQPSTEYTLTVLAYAPMGTLLTTSEPIVIKARTADMIVLDTPQPVVTIEANTVIVTWPEVTNAQSYNYVLTNVDGNELTSGSTPTEMVSFVGLGGGDYTVSIVAVVDAPGYQSSEAGTVDFTFTPQHNELWRVEGTYTSKILGSSWKAILVAYDDDSYSLLGWYGVEGYNLDFEYHPEEAEDMFWISDDYDYDEDYYTYLVPTGLSNPDVVEIYPWYNYCTFEGNQKAGKITLDVTALGKNKNDTFVWKEPTIDDICGTYTMTTNCWGWDWDTYSEEIEWNSTHTISVTKVDATTVKLPVPLFADYDIVGKVNLSAGTITFQPQDLDGEDSYGFTFASEDDADTPVVATINGDGTISINGWCFWYDGYDYFWDAITTLRR